MDTSGTTSGTSNLQRPAQVIEREHSPGLQRQSDALFQSPLFRDADDADVAELPARGSIPSAFCFSPKPPTRISVSPTATRPTRSPDPSTRSENRKEFHQHVCQPSRSPSRPAGAVQSGLPLRHAGQGNRRNYQAARKPLVAQPDGSATTQASQLRHVKVQPVIASAESADNNLRQPRTQPLLPDLTQFTNSHITKDDESITLQELAHVVRLSKYQERKRANTRVRLQRSLVSTALSSRLTRCGDIAHRNLVDCFRKDDKEGFGLLYNAIQDIRTSCDELRRYALLEPDMEPISSPILGSSESPDTASSSTVAAGPLCSITPFLHEMSAMARDTFLDFLSDIRTNPDYLATRICALSSAELNAFLSFHKGMEPVESVLPFHSRSASRNHGSSTNRSGAASDLERLLSFQRHDPLSILIHSCFANSAGPDSTEDRRRTEIWATVLARLIQQPKSNGEHFLISVLNIWTAMRDWSGKSNMEWYLMKILEDGAFILDRAEDQHGTRFNLSDWNPSDEAAARDFYDTAVSGLFDIIDDEDATGIPEGLLELGNAIVNKLDHRYMENTSRWLVWRCLFFVFLLGVIVHPESYGMLAEYHITPYAREKILTKVAMKAHEYVSSMWSGKPSATCVPVDVPPRIKAHVERIHARFQGAQSKVSTPKLLPARSITSLRETVEVHPYLVLSPSDLVTLVNALFPERRPMSGSMSMSIPGMSSTLQSGPASASGLSALSQQASGSNGYRANNMETASIISTSISSVVSDGTTAAPEGVRDVQSNDEFFQKSSAPSAHSQAQRRLHQHEDDGYRLRLAVHEMNQTLGPEATQGKGHPCAERWIVLFLSADGTKLSTTMTYDPDDEVDDDDSSSTDDVEGEDAQGSELGKGYHSLRDAILKLVEEYEIPQSLEKIGKGGAQLTNRASKLRKYKSKNKVIATGKPMSSRNPYRHHSGQNVYSPGVDFGAPTGTATSIDDTVGDGDGDGGGGDEGDGDDNTEPILMQMLRAASSQSRAQADFVSAHVYWKTLQHLTYLESPSLRENGFTVLINIFSRGPRDSIRQSAAAIEEYDAWLIWLKQSQERHEGLIDQMMKRVRALRDKMWYVADVLNSKEYTHSRDICQALKTMGMPRRWDSLQRSRANVGRGHGGTSYLYRTESQIVDLLAASEDQGGPNKLSDDQAELTAKWLQQYGIENFCQGEERIHRFCLEVEKCISKLIGETIRDAPVLWSSDLFKREKVVFDRLRARARDQAWKLYGDDGSSVNSDSERRMGSTTSTRPGWLGRDSRTYGVSSGSSQHSTDTGSRVNFARPRSSLSDMVENHDYITKVSPLNTADSMTMSTFWSPFQPAMSLGSGHTRACSPPTSLTNFPTTFSGWYLHQTAIPSSSSVSTGRPGTSVSSSHETIFLQRAEDEKTRFLSGLRQTLTSLLLSDLGVQVLGRGSETDAWFNKFGQECLERKIYKDAEKAKKTDAGRAQQQRRDAKKAKEASSRGSPRPRVVEKKKCRRNLRDTDRQTEPPSGSLGDDMDGQDGSGSGNKGQASASSSTHAKDVSIEFPFRKAYCRLLNMLSVHPSPFAKLNALNELGSLITASLTWSSSKKLRATRSDAGSSTADDRGAHMHQASLDTQSSTLRPANQPDSEDASRPRQTNPETRPIFPNTLASTDGMTNEIERLLRDASIRPQSLFRDLQLIAAFVPPALLDSPDRGKAFWDTGLAALKLKSDVCLTMVEMADDVVAYHTKCRKSAAETGPIPPLTGGLAGNIASASTSATSRLPVPPPPPPSSTYTFHDVGQLWTITAKEGYPVAQRELALFYLSNPEYVEKTTLPLVKPREVFKQAVMERYASAAAAPSSAGVEMGGGGGGGGAVPTPAAAPAVTAAAAAAGSSPGGKKDGDVRTDVGLMCVAVHWMEEAERGGDALAKSFMRQNELVGGRGG
ncbi:hypothetical protein E4U58_001572 [Claviceps cyperi]|nr:hypothetical protein E4U58_001572 [Claviceps cyperi]